MKTTTTSKEELLELLKKKFPGCWFKDGALFSSSYQNSIWSGEGSSIDDMQLVNDYIESKKYELGVHVKMSKFLEKHGWYAELYDSGTVFFFQV